MAIDLLDSFFYDSKEDARKQREAENLAIQQIAGINLPNYGQLNYERPDYVGDVYVPTAQAETMGRTAYRDIQSDPELRRNQLAQIAALEDIRNQGGLNLADRANLAEIRRQGGLDQQAQRNAIMQQAAMRGQAGSNMTLASLLQSQQSGANRLSNEDLRIAAMAQQRALDASKQMADISGNVRGQDFSENARIAEAEDAANKFNASIRSGMNQFNAGNQLRASMQGQNLRQQTANLGADIQRQQEIMNKYQIPTTRFGQESEKAKLLSGQYGQRAENIGKDIASRRAAQSQMFGGLTQVGGGLLNSMFGGGSGMGNGGSGTTSGIQGKKPGSQLDQNKMPYNEDQYTSGTTQGDYYDYSPQRKQDDDYTVYA